MSQFAKFAVMLWGRHRAGVPIGATTQLPGTLAGARQGHHESPKSEVSDNKA